MSKDKKVGIPNPGVTIGGDAKDRQIAGFVAEAIERNLMPAINAFHEQLTATDAILEDAVKRVEKLEKRNDIKITHGVTKELLGVLIGKEKK